MAEDDVIDDNPMVTEPDFCRCERRGIVGLGVVLVATDSLKLPCFPLVVDGAQPPAVATPHEHCRVARLALESHEVTSADVSKLRGVGRCLHGCF